MTKKLSLNRETLRTLSQDAAFRVRGAEGTDFCVQATDECAPTDNCVPLSNACTTGTVTSGAITCDGCGLN